MGTHPLKLRAKNFSVRFAQPMANSMLSSSGTLPDEKAGIGGIGPLARYREEIQSNLASPCTWSSAYIPYRDNHIPTWYNE
ncbi:predicted protein [Botrytis cinerea T4]|uniref:Uncharacterized protein n=1 Tax=Botryotinia fuckeliana (strain T4) TaxID=999810 RepID=G2Y8E1_BOTF4|nr:predicted protein [Botrytis cinerea T4]